MPSDMDAPGCYRCLFPARQLRVQGGFEVLLPPFERRLQSDGRVNFKFSVGVDPPSPMAEVWFLQQRLERDWASGWAHRLREWGVVTVADVDDNYLELPEWNPAFYGTHPYRNQDGRIINRSERRLIARANGWQRTPPNKSNRLWMEETFRQVDAMTVSTPYLKEVYGRFNSDVTVVRNYLDWDIWKDVQPQYDVYRGGRIRIGYSGVWRFRRGDIELLQLVVAPFLAKHPEVDFVAYSPEVHEFLQVPMEQRVLVPEYGFMPKDDEGIYPVGHKTAVMDISLIPLAAGGMNEGKSHLKGMEANAAGIPFIASNTESYRYWTEGKTDVGLIANTPGEWREQLEWLVSHDDERRQMGLNGRQQASRHRIQHHWPQYQDLFLRLKGDRYKQLARGAVARGAVQKVSELAELLRLVEPSGVGTVLEVGSARGGTFWAFSQIAYEDALLISVDIPSGSPLDVRDGEDVYSGRDRDRFKHFVKERQKVRLIDGNSQEQSTFALVVHALAGRQVDLLMIDADHRYPGVLRDWQLYRPLVRPGGWVAFHDVIRQNDPRSGVHVLWGELTRRAQDCWEFVGGDNWGLGTWGGIGVIRV